MSTSERGVPTGPLTPCLVAMSAALALHGVVRVEAQASDVAAVQEKRSAAAPDGGTAPDGRAGSDGATAPGSEAEVQGDEGRAPISVAASDADPDAASADEAGAPPVEAPSGGASLLAHGSSSSAAADVANRPLPTAPAFTAVVAGVPLRITGIMHARVEITQGVQSFDNATPVAPTSAVNPAVMQDPAAANLSFQVQQTRLGLIVGDPESFRGVVEIDFTHFDQSSPTVQAFPRIRVGLLEWQPTPGQRLFLGQTWDIFGNASGPQLLSHSFNLVGSLFRAGNVGFMRQQLGWTGRFDAVEVSIAAGLQGANTGPSFNAIEQSLVPTGAARVLFYVGERQVVGVSGIATSVRYMQAEATEMREALGAMVFTDSQIGTLNLHAELYVAQNLAGTGALTLGAGRFGVNVVEVGGYVSGREQLGQHAVAVGAGLAGVVNEAAVQPGYAPASPMGAPPTTLGVLTPAAGPGIVWNASGFLGYWYSPLPGLSIVVEPYFFLTRFAMDAQDIGLAAVRAATGARAGAMFQF